MSPLVDLHAVGCPTASGKGASGVNIYWTTQHITSSLSAAVIEQSDDCPYRKCGKGSQRLIHGSWMRRFQRISSDRVLVVCQMHGQFVSHLQVALLHPCDGDPNSLTFALLSGIRLQICLQNWTTEGFPPTGCGMPR
jgi:hypothetical protein